MGDKSPLHLLSLNELCNHILFFARLTTGEAAISTGNPVFKEERLGSMSHPSLLRYEGQVLHS